MNKKCGIEGCGDFAKVKGLCSGHYHRLWRYGTPEAPLRRVKTYDGRECSEPYCKRRPYSNGICERHYNVARYHSDEATAARKKARSQRQRREGLLAQEVEMRRPRPSRCEVCDEPGAAGYLGRPTAGICFDHDHADGAPRGWLCDRCNRTLGVVRDNPELLRKLAEYLERGGPPLDFPTFGVPVEMWRSLFREGNA